jgi:hypothetical protein
VKPIEGWVVRDPKGHRSLWLDRALAVACAARLHGTVHALVEAERAADLVQTPDWPHHPAQPDKGAAP